MLNPDEFSVDDLLSDIFKDDNANAPAPRVIGAPSLTEEVPSGPVGSPVSSNADTNADFDPELAKFESEAAELEAKAKVFNDELANAEAMIKAENDEINRIEAELKAAYAATAKRKRDLEASIWEVKKLAKSTQREAEQARAKLDEAKRARLSKAEFANLEKRWDAAVIDSPWFTSAKDHQLIAGRTTTAATRLILADVMGLGKTLSSFVSLDYVHAATAEATPTAPVQLMGLSMQNNKEIIRPCGRKVIFLCPSPRTQDTVLEAQRWAPHRSPINLGGLTKAERKFSLDILTRLDEFVAVINYESWRKDEAFLQGLINLGADTVILDEAHMLKDRNSNAYRGVYRLLFDSNKNECFMASVRRELLDTDTWPVGTGEVLSMQPVSGVPFILAMTGTPILNKPEEFYSLLTLVDDYHYPNTSYGLNEFMQRYCIRDYDNSKWRFAPGGASSLTKRVSHLYLRRTKDDAGIVLPPQTIQHHNLEVDEVTYSGQAEARAAMRKYAQILLDPDNNDGRAVSASIALTQYLRLRQIEVWPPAVKVSQKDFDGKVVDVISLADNPKFYESQKMDYVVDLIDQVAHDERTVVFSQFSDATAHDTLSELQRRVEALGFSCAVYTGNTSDAMREEIKRDADAYTVERDPNTNQPTPKFQVILANYKSGGVGLNFTDFSQTIILDEEWNPGKRDQAYGRTDRMGQTRPNTVHIVRMVKTIDDWMASLIDEKQDLIDGFDSNMSLTAQGLDALRRGLI